MSDATAVANPTSADEPSLIAPESTSAPGATETAPQGESGDSTQSAQTSEPPKWVHQLNGELKANPLITKHANINDLAAEYAEYASKAERLVEIPGDDADEEAWKAFAARLRPEDPSGYEFDTPEDIPYSEDGANQFRALAHELGLTQAQAKRLHQYDVERARQALSAQSAQRKEQLDSLRKEWGDRFDVNLKQAQASFRKIAETLKDEGFANRMLESGAGKDPNMLKTFYGIWQLIKDDSIVEGEVAPQTQGDGFYPNTPAEG